MQTRRAAGTAQRRQQVRAASIIVRKGTSTPPLHWQAQSETGRGDAEAADCQTRSEQAERAYQPQGESNWQPHRRAPEDSRSKHLSSLGHAVRRSA